MSWKEDTAGFYAFLVVILNVFWSVGVLRFIIWFCINWANLGEEKEL